MTAPSAASRAKRHYRSIAWRPIDEPEASGHVARVRDPEDRRRNQVALTDPGRALLAELSVAEQRSQHGLLDALSPEEQRTLLNLLRRVLDANDERSNGQSEASAPSRSS